MSSTETQMAAPVIPPITPDMKAPGVNGLFSLGNQLAAYALGVAVLAIIIGIILAVGGPRLGFQHARSMGVGGIVGGVIVGAVLATATNAVTTTWTLFGGT